MDITFPPELQWVSYLAGGAWPQGSETRMGRIGGHFVSAAGDLQDLLPDLNRVRNETVSVLSGDTEMAALEQFAMLFDGDYSVDTLTNGVSALGDGAQNLGVEIQYSKLSIIVGLAIAAAEISFSLANSVPTGGASLAWIPTIEWTTMTSIRRLMSTVFERIATKLGQILRETTIKDLIEHGTREAFQGLGHGLAQEGITQGIQVGQGTAKWRPGLFRENGIASFIGGAAGGGTALPVGHALGEAESKLGRAAKGMTTMFSAGIGGNVAGTTAVGGEFDTVSVLAGSAGSSIGGIKGHGAHGRETEENQSNSDERGQPPPLGPRPPGSPTPDTPIAPTDGSPNGSRDGASAITDPQRHPDTSSVTGNGPAPQSGNGTRVSDSPTPDTVSTAATHANGTAVQKDSVTATAPTAGHGSTGGDTESATHASPATRPPDGVDPRIQSSNSSHLLDANTANERSGPRPAPGDPITEKTPPPTQDGNAPIVHTPGDPSQQTVDRANVPRTDAASVQSAAEGAPTATPSTPTTHTPALGAAPPTHTPTQTPTTSAPKQTVREDIQASPAPAASTSKVSETPAARVQDTTAARAKPSTQPGDVEQAAVARAASDDQPGSRVVDPTTPGTDRSAQPHADCLDRVAQALSDKYRRQIKLAPFSTSEGAPARVLYETFDCRAEFADYQRIDTVLRTMKPGSSAIVTSRWTGGPKRGGHAYLAVFDGKDVHLEDPYSRKRYDSGWPPHWGEGEVSRTAVGYLDDSGEPAHRLTGAPGELAAAAAIGHVQGLSSDGEGSHHADHSAVSSVDTRSEEIVREALRDRGISSADELINTFKDSDEACARACKNAAWWDGLTDTQRDELIKAYPKQVGSAEGIFAEHRDAANRHRLDVFRGRAAEIQAKVDRAEQPTKEELKFLLRVNKIDTALHNAAAEAERLGIRGGPKLLYFDPMEFGKDGRAIVSFGDDPYKAAAVAWLVPGFATTIDKLNVNMRGALHLLESAHREDPNLSAAAIAWIGYDAPNDMHAPRVVAPGLARAGGEILYSDIRAFNSARNTLAGDGSEFTGNHIFGHSYGSTTTAYAGRDGRLADHVTTVTLLGSPGAGKLHNASQFGIGADKVFVASSSKDPVTALGGRTPGQDSRINRRLGLGIDPAMKSFGAVRITAELPGALNTTGSVGTHTAYYHYVDVGAHPAVRTESLANFGRILVGHLDEVHTDQHRMLDASRRRLGTIEPAADRPLRLDDDTGREHSRGREKLIRLNPRWRAGDAGETDRLTRELSTIEEGDDERAAAPIGVAPPTVDDHHAHMAKDALRDRIPPLEPDQADRLVNPLHDSRLAEARARHNAAWWRELTDEQRHAVSQTFPREIGNAEGIDAADRDAANRRMLEIHRDRAAVVQTKLTDGEKPTANELSFLLRMNKLDTALENASVAAKRAGLKDPPLLLAFDPPAFKGDGRAVVSFGDDPYTAKTVAWYVPGVGAQLDRLDYCMHTALNILQSTRHENPTLSAASIAWIGYDAPNGGHTWRAAGKTLARRGGEILYSDVRAFNAARDTMNGDASHFSGNHIFGHSYGSTTTSYAGARGRLATHVRTITLIGSPGAGPIRHASAFGIGADNVFVLSSSADRIARLGGVTPTSDGRFGGLGLGTDPAMESFGARRAAAEFLPEMNRKDTTGTHNAYFDYLETDGPRRWLVTPHSPIRTEALANFGRIAAGHTERLHFEEHRSLDDSGHRVEPAAGRRLHHEDATADLQSTDRHVRFRWLRKLFRNNDCGPQVIDELSAMYRANGHNFRLDADPSSRGVPASKLFEAIKSGSRFATHDEVTRQLQELGHGSSALLVSRWHGNGRGGHAYLAVNTPDGIVLHDHHTREASGEWPPKWGQDAVKRTAVGYLKPDGEPLDGLKGDYRKLGAADTIGRVRGLPGDDVQGPPADPDLLRRQEEYRVQDPANRHVDTRYAEPLGDVVDNPSPAAVDQLAKDLSGTYGPHRIRLEGEVVNGEVMLTGRIFNGDTEIGTIQRIFYRDSEGNLVAYHSGLVIKDEFKNLRGQGFSKALTSELERYYVHSGVDRIGLHTHDLGGYAWSRRGFTWDPDPRAQQKAFDAIEVSANRLRDQVSPEAQAALDQVVAQLDPDNPRLPEPIDVANLAASDEPELGRRLLDGLGLRRDGSGLDLVRYMPRDASVDAAAQSHSGFGARLKRLFGLGEDSRADQDCAYALADELSAMYEGRDFNVVTARSPMGTPAWALFHAVGCRAEFATYDEVTAKLHELGEGSSAVLTSRWVDGRGGGHAYLAINEGNGKLSLYDPRTREHSGWPPEWGQRAVAQTAVGYLDAHGEPAPEHGLTADVPLQLQLAAADVIGDVKGHPTDPDFLQHQAHYRAQDQTTRQVDTRYAEPLADIVDQVGDQATVDRLAEDLSGVYGPYRVEMWRAQSLEGTGEVIVGGSILSGGEEVGFVQRTFYRDAAGNLVVHDDVVEIPDKQFRFKGFSKALTDQLESYYVRSGVDRIEMRTEQDGGHAWARRGFTWNPDPRKLQESFDSIKESARELRDRVSPEAQTLLDEIVERLDPRRPDLAEPIDLAALSTPSEPDLGRQLLTDTHWHGVKYLRDASVDTPSPDVPLRLGTVEALPEPVSELDLPNYEPSSLSDAEASTVHAHGEQRMRELNDEFIGVGVSAEERARVLSELRNSLRSWTHDLMSNRTTAEFLAASESNPTFDELVARNEARGLTGDAVYEAIVHSATHGRFTPGTLSDVETTSVYSDFELRLRQLNERLADNGMPVDERARLLSDLRTSLRSWTRDLMSNRAAADWLTANESNPSFEDLVARNEAKGLTGGAVYEAIVDSATHSHYAAGTLSNEETRTVYTTLELQMREVSANLRRDEVGLEERAKTLYELRAGIRTWTRSLMADREAAEYLTANEPNPSFEDLVERQRAKGRVGDEIYEAIIASATRSRPSVNESLGIDPNNPPPLPPMRGPTNND